MRAAGGEAEQRAGGARMPDAARGSFRGAGKDGRDDGDVGQVRAAREGIVENPRDAGGVALVEHGGDCGRHRAEVHGDVLGLHDHLPVGVEQRGGGVAALLDVRRVRGVDQHDAHLLTGGAQRAADDLQFDRV
jgi:hypothetical protein